MRNFGFNEKKVESLEKKCSLSACFDNLVQILQKQPHSAFSLRKWDLTTLTHHPTIMVSIQVSVKPPQVDACRWGLSKVGACRGGGCRKWTHADLVRGFVRSGHL